MTLPTGTTTDGGRVPARALLQRIDIGLTTGIIAVLVAFLSLIVAHSQTKMALETQKANVLPIIDIDRGYNTSGAPLEFSVALNNVGVGLADIRSVKTRIKGKLVTEDEFISAVMSPNMKAWADTLDGEATGFLRAGESQVLTTYSIRNAFQARAADYFSGKSGVPMDGVDIEVCYCSVMKDCWTVSYLDRKRPQDVNSCKVGDVPEDSFEDYRETRRMAAAEKSNQKTTETTDNK